MRISAHLDVDVIAVETDDHLSVLIEMTAPAAPQDAAPRPPSTLEVVLDRSGSMSGGRLDGAKLALTGLIDKLDPTDNFGLVVFDNAVEVVVPAGPLRDKPAVRHAISQVFARGNTDLSSGYLRGLQEAGRIAGKTGATLLLISDGHANAGVTDPARLGSIAAKAHGDGVTTSTLGYGLGYDEKLLSAIARGGSGNELFAEEPDTAGALIAGEVEGLLSQTAQAASLLVKVSPQVRSVQVVNDLPVTSTGDGIMAELGSFYSDETRKLVLTFEIPAVAALGLTQVATCEFTWVELPSLVQHTLTVPLHVNVVPGDEAAGRVADPTVRTELVYLQVQQAKRRASTHLTAGDAEAALGEIQRARVDLRDAIVTAPPAMQSDLAEEAAALDYLADQTQQGMIARAAKYSSMDSHYKSRKRGRLQPPQPNQPPQSNQPNQPNQPQQPPADPAA
jgi:Ca-activated chloride channel homolog